MSASETRREPAGTARIALVAIVRDEADWIEGLLAEHRDLWDEAVVVDTGSRDATPALAADGGARVIHHPWNDDFAAARNAGLAAATADWILVLDADERIDEGDRRRLRAAATDRPVCWLCEQRNYTDRREHPAWQPVAGDDPVRQAGQPGFVVAHNARLFPRHPQLRYEGIVHETVEPAALRLGWPVSLLPVVIHHYGHVRRGPGAERRQQLYGRLVRRKLALEPGSLRARLELATQLLGERRPAEALEILAALAGSEEKDADTIRGRLLLAWAYRRLGRAGEAVEVSARALRERPQWLFSWVHAAASLLEAGRLRETDLHLEQARRLFGPHPLLLRLLCRLQLETGRLEDACRTARRLRDLCPGWGEAVTLHERCERLRSGEFASAGPLRDPAG